MKRLIYLFAISFLLLSCEDYGEYHYEISNEIEYSTIQIKIEVNGVVEKDSFNISSFERTRILTTEGGNLGGPDPNDIFKDSLSAIHSFKLYINGELVDKNFKNREYWEFTKNGNQSSTYLLRVKQEIIE